MVFNIRRKIALWAHCALPTCMPPGLEATPENIPALKEWILNYYGATSFNTCEHQPLRMMQGEPMHLHVDPEAKPSAVQKPAVVPIHWQERVFKDLERCPPWNS